MKTIQPQIHCHQGVNDTLKLAMSFDGEIFYLWKIPLEENCLSESELEILQ